MDLSTYVFVRFLLSILSILPYPTKIAMGGLIYQKVISPLSGNRKRIIDNLKLVFPNLEKEKREELCTKVPNNIGRTFLNYCLQMSFLASRNQPKYLDLVLKHLGMLKKKEKLLS